MAQMPFAEHNNMVKTIPSDRTDQPLRVSVLPWRPWRGRPVPYPHCSKPLDDDIAIDAIPITNDISWRLLPAVGFGQLTGDPTGTRACGHTQPQKLTAGIQQESKTIQTPQREGGGNEQKQQPTAPGMIAPKGISPLRTRATSPPHIICHAGLPA